MKVDRKTCHGYQIMEDEAGMTDVSFCAFCHNVDLGSEMLYNVKSNKNRSPRLTRQAGVKQN
jgi:hypothetical protein